MEGRLLGIRSFCTCMVRVSTRVSGYHSMASPVYVHSKDEGDKFSWDESTKREMAGEDLIPECGIKTGQQIKL